MKFDFTPENLDRTFDFEHNDVIVHYFPGYFSQGK